MFDAKLSEETYIQEHEETRQEHQQTSAVNIVLIVGPKQCQGE